METQNIQSTLTSLSAAQITIIASSVGAVIAALVAASFSFLTTWLVKRAENERALRELVIKYAIESQNQHLENAKLSDKPSAILPLEGYIVHIASIVDVLLRKRITKQNIPKLLDEIASVTESSNEHLKHTRDYRRKRV